MNSGAGLRGEVADVSLFTRLLLLKTELERVGVDTESQTGRLWPIVEYVSQVAIASSAKHFGANHSVASVHASPNVFLVYGLEEARPPGSRMKLGVGCEEIQIATRTGVGSRLIGIVEQPTEWRFRSLLAQNAKLLWSQNLFPLFVGLDNLILSLRASRSRPRNSTLFVELSNHLARSTERGKRKNGQANQSNDQTDSFHLLTLSYAELVHNQRQGLAFTCNCPLCYGAKAFPIIYVCGEWL